MIALIVYLKKYNLAADLKFNLDDMTFQLFHTNIISSRLKRILFFFLLVLNCIYSFTIAQEYKPGTTFYGTNNYVQYSAGNLPLILSSPHNGSISPTDIPDRTYGELVTDARTQLIAKLLSSQLYSLTKKYPHVILCNLKRTKLDANRDSVEAAQGNPIAIKAWKEYHNFIYSSAKQVIASYGKGLYLDLHQHGHTIQRLELGYLLAGSIYDKTDDQLNSAEYINTSSVKYLVNNNPHTKKLSEVIRGEYGFGTLIQGTSIAAVPGMFMLSPKGADYFTGGYSTEIHGLKNGGSIDGIQIEHNSIGITDSDANTSAYVKKLAPVILQYLNHFYGFNFTTDIKSDKEIVTDYRLEQNYPNPFNPTTTIGFSVPRRSNVELKIYDVLGREIMMLMKEEKAAGNYSVDFDGEKLSSGIYFYSMSSGKYFETKKLLLLK